MQDQAQYSITFRIESQLHQISLIRAALSGVLRHLGVAEADIFSLELAVTEVINNTLEHGYRGVTDKPVDVHVTLSGSEVKIEVKDYAPAFPEDQLYRLKDTPEPLEDPSENWPMRGHGLQIVRQIVDSIDIRSEQNFNCMTITKQISLEKS